MPLTSADLERYERELPALMPERRISTLRGALTPGAAAVVDVSGFDSVVVARRAANGTTVQTCVDDMGGAMDFFGAQRTSHAGETE